MNPVSLGVMKTAMVDASSYARLAAVLPLGQMGEIADVVDGIHHPERASFVTGKILNIDGGQSTGHGNPYQPSPSRPLKRRSSHAF